MVVSWDCFDTLIGRSYVYPRSIFDIISEKTKDKNFTHNRIDAEKRVKEKTLKNIYKLLPNHNPELELAIEKEYSFPIIENFNRIRDGDIIVSDTYLSDKELWDLLKYHGLNKKVSIYTSYGNKANAEIWKKIFLRHKIDYHIGDNLFSDVLQPRTKAIKTIFYPRSQLSCHEKYIEKYNRYLSYWIRQLRLSNPYFGQNQILITDTHSYQYLFSYSWIKETNGKIEILDDKPLLDKDDINWENRWSDRSRDGNRMLWDEQSSFNTPILILIALGLPSIKQIVFMMRDSFYLHKIYENITGNKADLVHANRKSLNWPYNNEYLNYLIDSLSNKLVVDIHGTGGSLINFCSNYNINCDKLFVAEHCDFNSKNPELSHFGNCFNNMIDETLFSTRNHHNKKASIAGKKCCVGTILEKFNIINSGKLYGWSDNQPLRKKNEHDNETCNIFYNCINKALEISNNYIKKINYDEKLLQNLLLNIYNSKTYVNNTIHSLWD